MSPNVSRNECLQTKRTLPLSQYIGMVETFSSYQKLKNKDPAEAKHLSDHIRNKWDIELHQSSR